MLTNDKDRNTYVKLGIARGNSWARIIDPTDVVKAAFKMTTNEQIRRFQDYISCDSKAFYEEQWPVPIIPPYIATVWGEKIAGFFIKALNEFPQFNVAADPNEDPDIVVDETYFPESIPNADFRAFEDGWAIAVRTYTCTSSDKEFKYTELCKLRLSGVSKIFKGLLITTGTARI